MEKPILFSSEMVRAILDGRKTQTRRVIMPQPMFSNVAVNGMTLERQIADEKAWWIVYKCPYGRPGDLLWVRETHNIQQIKQGWRVGYYADDSVLEYPMGYIRWHEVADSLSNYKSGTKRPSIFMPRWASRLTLRVVDVRVERVQDISEADAKAEGVNMATWELHHRRDDSISLGIAALEEFKHLWDSINAQRGYSWDSNPWVWVVEFEVVK